MTKPLLILIVSGLCLLPAAFAQSAAAEGVAVSASEQTVEEGIPVTDPLVISRCGTCHTKDAKGNLTRISWERTTPEGWEEAIKRMVRLNGLTITPSEARAVVKYLATYHGLAPEEAKPVMYMPEHRLVDENIANNTVHDTCANCHALGRALSWRRTKADWRLLANMHSFLYAQADNIFRRGSGAFPDVHGPRVPRADAPEPATPQREPVDIAIDYLAKAAPLHTTEWATWRARMRPPKLGWPMAGLRKSAWTWPILRRDADRCGFSRRRIHLADQADIGEGRIHAHSYRERAGIHRLFMARPVHGRG